MSLGWPGALLPMMLGGAAYFFVERYQKMLEPVDETIATALEKAGQGLEVDAQGIVTVQKASEAIGRLGEMWRDAEAKILGLRRSVMRMSAEIARAQKDEREARADAARAREQLAIADHAARAREEAIRELEEQLARKGKRR